MRMKRTHCTQRATQDMLWVTPERRSCTYGSAVGANPQTLTNRFFSNRRPSIAGCGAGPRSRPEPPFPPLRGEESGAQLLGGVFFPPARAPADPAVASGRTLYGDPVPATPASV